jgi:hypothetical protein
MSFPVMVHCNHLPPLKKNRSALVLDSLFAGMEEMLDTYPPDLKMMSLGHHHLVVF